MTGTEWMDRALLRLQSLHRNPAGECIPLDLTRTQATVAAILTTFAERGVWRTIPELAQNYEDVTGVRLGECSISARVRDLRKEGLVVHRRRRGHTWEYMLELER